MEDRITYLYLYNFIEKRKFATMLQTFDLRVERSDELIKSFKRLVRSPPITNFHTSTYKGSREAYKLVELYIVNKSIQHMYLDKNELRKVVHTVIFDTNDSLNEYNIGLYTSELNKLIKKINVKIDRAWDGPSTFWLWKEKWLSRFRKIAIKFYTRRVIRKLNGYLEDTIPVKVKKAFKVFG